MLPCANASVQPSPSLMTEHRDIGTHEVQASRMGDEKLEETWEEDYTL